MSVFSIATGTAGEVPRAEALARIAHAGFTSVELGGDADHLDGWPSDPAGMRRDLASFGLTARSVHLPTRAWNVGNPDAATRRDALEAARACFGQAAEVGAGVVICHPNASTQPFTAETFATNLARSREAVAAMAEYAADAGVRMALENLPARHLPRPGATVAQALGLIEGLGAHVGICLDAGHANSNGLSAAAEARAAGALLLALHLQDNDGLGEDQHLLPGDGTTDWGALLRALNEMRFAGLLTFEVAGGDAPCETLATLAALREEWKAR